MAESDRLYFRAESELIERVDRFQVAHGHEDRSKATRELVEIGLRESQAPILYRAKARGTDAAFFLTLASLVSLAIGYSTDVLTPVQSVQIGMVLVAMGVGILGMIELARAMNGQSEIGAFVRGVRQ